MYILETYLNTNEIVPGNFATVLLTQRWLVDKWITKESFSDVLNNAAFHAFTLSKACCFYFFHTVPFLCQLFHWFNGFRYIETSIKVFVVDYQ